MPTCWIIAGPNGAGKTTFYLALPDKAMSHQRVAERVRHGGHDIPAADIERRFARSLRHLLHDFSHQVDRCECFLNVGASAQLIFRQERTMRAVRDADHYRNLLKQSLP